MVVYKTGVFVYSDINQEISFEGCGYLETQLTFVSDGRYSVTIRYNIDGEDKVITITGKGLSRITINTDRFKIENINSQQKLKIIVNNIKDYFFDLLSEN